MNPSTPQNLADITGFDCIDNVHQHGTRCMAQI